MRGILVATERGLFRLEGDVTEELPAREARSLSGEGSERWAIVDRREVRRRSPGGSWREVARLEDEHGELRLVSLLVAGDEVLAGTSQARLLRLEDGRFRFARSFDEAPGRDAWYTPWGGPPDVRSMSRSRDGTWWVNVHVGGVLRSEKGGRSWEPTIDIDDDVHQVLFHDESRMLLVASGVGFAASDDGGRTWRRDASGLHGEYCRAVAVAGEALLLTASTGPRSDRAAIYRRPLRSAAPFERSHEGLPDWFGENINTYCLAGDGPDAVFGTAGGSVYVSEDEGRSWSLVAEGLPAVRSVIFG